MSVKERTRSTGTTCATSPHETCDCVKDTGQSLDGPLLLGAVFDSSQPGKNTLEEAVHRLQHGYLTEHAHAACRHVAHRCVRVLQTGEQVGKVLQQLEKERTQVVIKHI